LVTRPSEYIRHLSPRHILGVLRGDVAPKDLPVTVRYRAGRASVFRVEAGPLGRVEER
jgi:hypothetical protein